MVCKNAVGVKDLCPQLVEMQLEIIQELLQLVALKTLTTNQHKSNKHQHKLIELTKNHSTSTRLIRLVTIIKNT